jgi:hypothetical protein
MGACAVGAPAVGCGEPRPHLPRPHLPQEYVYEGKAFVGIRLRKFFGLGEGRLVPVAVLHGLWRKRFDAAEVKPAVLKPSLGKDGPAEPKLKRSRGHNLEHFAAKRGRKHAREQRQAEEMERALEEDRKRVEERTTFGCAYASRGCRHRPFLSKQGAAAHSRVCIYSGKGKHQPNECWVKLRVHIRSGVRAGVQVQQSVSQEPRVALQLHPCVATDMPTCSALKVQRPLQPDRPYGLQPHTSMVAHRSEEARSSAASTLSCKHVHVALQVGRDGHVRFCYALKRGLAEHRGLPELLPQGWAVRPPKAHKRFTEEQRVFLVKLFDWPDGRLNEQQGYILFRKQFSAKDGPYARSLRLSRAQIKAWFSTEKARRLKAGAAVAAGATEGTPAAPANTDPSPAAAAPPAPAAGRSPAPPPAPPLAPPPAPPPAHAVHQRLTVPQMRAEMRQLGYSEAYVNGAKGTTAMRALHAKTIAIGRACAADERGDDSDSELGEVRVSTLRVATACE